MRLASLTSCCLAALIGCASPSSIPDAAPDVDADTWESEFNYEPRVTIRSTEPCADWDTVERFERGLPDDTTPRLLWRFRPTLDPQYPTDSEAPLSYLAYPTMSPDGMLWMVGPRPGFVARVTREGTVDSWKQYGHSDPFATSTLAVAPDGSAFLMGDMRSLTENPQSGTGTLMHFLPDRDAIRPTELLFPAPERSYLTIGPGGQVYVANGLKVVATCRAERILWELEFDAAPDLPEFKIATARMQPDGTLFVSATLARRTFTIDAAGTLGEPFANGVGPQTPEMEIIGQYDPDLDQRTVIVMIDGVEQRRSPPLTRWSFSPAHELWDDDGSEYKAWDALTGEPRRSLSRTAYARNHSEIPWDENGGWLRITEGGFSGVSADATVRWTVDPQRPEPGAGIAFRPGDTILDEGGVVYVMLSRGAGYELAAIQTDVLPATLDYCVEFGCNPFNDNWLRGEP